MKLLLSLLFALSTTGQHEFMTNKNKEIMEYVNKCGTDQESKVRAYLPLVSDEFKLAAYHYGLMLKDGTCGIDVDMNAAVHYLEFASTSSNPKAMYEYATILRTDKAFADKKKADELMLTAAKLRHPEAMYYTGKELLKKRKTQDEGLKYLEKAADAGVDNAYYWVAGYYGQSGDKKTMLDWLQKGSSKGLDKVTALLFMTYTSNALGTQDLSKANKVALESYNKKSAIGYELHAISHLFKIADNSNNEQAFFDFIKSARKGSKVSQLMLACMYFDGLYKKRDLQQATYWLNKSNVERSSDDNNIIDAQLVNYTLTFKDNWPFTKSPDNLKTDLCAVNLEHFNPMLGG